MINTKQTIDLTSNILDVQHQIQVNKNLSNLSNHTTSTTTQLNEQN